jgi:Cof subfamily protein (haloacid dehalogenase superfamily)
MAKLTDFKALLFDIDGTLTNKKSEITDETITALKKLADLGYTIGFCTGRGLPGVKNKFLPLFPEDSIHIATGGSQLVNSKGEILWEQPINPETVKKIKDHISSTNLVSVFMKSDALYAKEPTLGNLLAHPWNQIAKNIDSMDNQAVGAIYVSNVDAGFVEYLNNDPSISYKKMIGSSGNHYVDITSAGINKSVSLKKWSQHTGIVIQDIIGFGDSENDLEFLQDCGFSVAMGNATDELKQIANTVIGHTNENGLAKYLNNIIKGENL